MSITTGWYDQNERIMLYQFDASWSWDDFAQAMREEAVMAASIGLEPYDVIADMTHSTMIPLNTNLKSLQHTVERTPSNWRSTVIVNGSEFLRLLLRSLSLLSPNSAFNTHHAKTIDEALEMIVQFRQSVKP